MNLSARHSEKDISYHNYIASQYDRVVVDPRWASINALFRPILRHLPAQRRRMLDVGTGTGHMLRRYAALFENVTAIDHSSAMLAQARETAGRLGLRNVEFALSDAQVYLDDVREPYDFISCVGFLHHLQPSALVDLLTSAGRALDANGVVVISEPIRTNDAEPGAIAWWNRTYRTRPEAYEEESGAPQDPDEEPLDLLHLREALRKSGLHVVGEGRGWEIFPRSRGAVDRIAIPLLHKLYGRTGPVYWACCRKNNERTTGHLR